MQTSFTTQIQTIKNVRALVAENKEIAGALTVAAAQDVDLVLSDAGASLAAFSLGYGEKKRAIELIEKLIEKLNTLGDKSLVKEEAINYVIQFKK